MRPSENPVLALYRAKAEDALVEYFRGVLTELKLVRVWLSHVLPDVGLPREVDMQCHQSHGSCEPDIEITGDGFYCIIEAKLDAPLTAKQWRSYVRLLAKWKEGEKRMGENKKSTACLVLLAPEAKESDLRKKALATCVPSKHRNALERSGADDFFWVSWQDVRKFVQSRCGASGGTARTHLEDLLVLLDHKVPRPLGRIRKGIEKMKTKEAVEAFNQIVGIIDRVRRRLSAKWCGEHWPTDDDSFVGVYTTATRRPWEYVSIGLWVGEWRRQPRYPLSLSITGTKRPKEADWEKRRDGRKIHWVKTFDLRSGRSAKSADAIVEEIIDAARPYLQAKAVS